jgi:hypothetical protein
VEVAAGQFATAADGVELACLRADTHRQTALAIPRSAVIPPGGKPKPLVHLYGKILFEDEFDKGLGNWDVVEGASEDRLEVVNPGPDAPVIVGRNFYNDGRDLEAGVLINVREITRHQLNLPKPIGGRWIGIRSKRPIQAERFVVEAVLCFTYGADNEKTVPGMRGVELKDASCVEGLQPRVPSAWSLHSWEITPVEAADGRKEVLSRWFIAILDPRSEFVHTDFVESSRAHSANGKILFLVKGGAMIIDNVVVREMGKDE